MGEPVTGNGIGMSYLRTVAVLAGMLLRGERPPQDAVPRFLLQLALDLADCGVIAGAILSTESGKPQGVSG